MHDSPDRAAWLRRGGADQLWTKQTALEPHSPAAVAGTQTVRQPAPWAAGVTRASQSPPRNHGCRPRPPPTIKQVGGLSVANALTQGGAVRLTVPRFTGSVLECRELSRRGSGGESRPERRRPGPAAGVVERTGAAAEQRSNDGGGAVPAPAPMWLGRLRLLIAWARGRLRCRRRWRGVVRRTRRSGPRRA